MEPRLI